MHCTNVLLAHLDDLALSAPDEADAHLSSWAAPRFLTFLKITSAVLRARCLPVFTSRPGLIKLN